jgi:hypothetical protein
MIDVAPAWKSLGARWLDLFLAVPQMRIETVEARHSDDTDSSRHLPITSRPSGGFRGARDTIHGLQTFAGVGHFTRHDLGEVATRVESTSLLITCLPLTSIRRSVSTTRVRSSPT